jgi:hypothetical protein
VWSQFLRVAHAYKKEFGRRLWQPFGYEHVLRDDEDVITVARYILANPVRAGLVATVMDYPFLGSQVYELKDLIESLPITDSGSTKVEPYRRSRHG